MTVRYCGREVLKRTVSGHTGCRLCYDDLNITDRLDDFLLNEFGQMVRYDTIRDDMFTFAQKLIKKRASLISSTVQERE